MDSRIRQGISRCYADDCLGSREGLQESPVHCREPLSSNPLHILRHSHPGDEKSKVRCFHSQMRRSSRRVLLTTRVRQLELEIERLIGWAATAIEKSTNQPMLPYAIIVINAVDIRTDAKWLD